MKFIPPFFLEGLYFTMAIFFLLVFYEHGIVTLTFEQVQSVKNFSNGKQ